MINVIVHCSDSSWGNASVITQWHVLPPPKGRGFSAIGYHYVILNGLLSPYKRNSYFDGHIETGRPLDDDADMELDERGAHAFGYNSGVGICLIGLSGTFTEAQMRSLSHLVGRLRVQFGGIGIKVLQHSDVEPKKPQCAGLTKLQLAVLNKI
jgi:N-acetylmuramoyl-L-alanine amidase